MPCHMTQKEFDKGAEHLHETVKRLDKSLSTISKEKNCKIDSDKITCDVPKMLPVYKIKGNLYFRDERLGEFRNIKNPTDKVLISSNPKLQKPTEQDRKEIFSNELNYAYTH